MNPSRRKAIYEQFQKLVAQQLPLIYTVVPDSIAAIRNGYGNVKPTPHGYGNVKPTPHGYGNVKPTPHGGLVWNADEIYDLNATRAKP